MNLQEMTDDRDSESRWAAQYKAERDKWQGIAAKYAQEREHNANMALAYKSERDALHSALSLMDYEDMLSPRNESFDRKTARRKAREILRKKLT